MIKVIGIGLALVSAACTAHWLYGLSVESMGMVAAIVTAVSGLLLEFAKFHFATHWQGWTLRGAVTGTVTAGLMAASIGATYLYLDSALQAPAREGELQRLRVELASLDQQIAQVESNVAVLSGMEHISKAQRFLSELEPVRDRRAAVAGELARKEKSAPPDILAEYSWAIFLMIAVLVDVVGALCLLPVHQLPETQVDQAETPFDAEEVERAKRLIVQRELKPTASALNRALNIDKPVAVSILQHLTREGILVQQGRNNRYAISEVA